MGRVENQLKLVTEKCKIFYKEQLISTPPLLQAFIRYISITFNRREHNIGIIQHTDSICFDILLITFSAFINLLSNSSSTEDFLLGLKPGDMVLYQTGKKIERYVYEGRETKNNFEYIILGQKDGKTFVPPLLQNKISPYNGTSSRQDGRGIRTKHNSALNDFYSIVLGFPTEDIPSVFNTSSIIIAPKDKANILKHIDVVFGDKKYPLTSLITAAYFTDGEKPFYLGTNPGKTEVLLKFVSKVSVARKLLRARDGNQHLGVMVLGEQILHRCESELPALVNRQNLKYVYLSSVTNSQFGENLLQENDDVSLFACTKKFIEKYPVNIKNMNPLLIQLSMQMETIEKKEIKPQVIKSYLNWELYSSFKRALSIIHKSDYETDEKYTFIKYAFSLMKIFTTSVFPISDLDKYNLENSNLTIRNRIDELNALHDTLPEYLSEKSSYVIDVLEMLYMNMKYSNIKVEELKKIILSNKENKRIAIIVPKTYYIAVMHYCVTFGRSNIFIFTANNFVGNQHFDIIISVGHIEGRKFNVFTCNASQLIIPLLYEHEYKKFRFEKKKINTANKLYNSRLTIKSKSFIMAEDEEDDDIDEQEIQNINEIDNALDNYISDIELNIEIKNFTNGLSGRGAISSEIVKAATFTDGSKALFTKHFKAYVFDTDDGKITEKAVDELSDGDSLVFTQNNNETKDIVDTVLKQLINENKLQNSTVEAYRKSKKWKQNLHEYVDLNNLTARKLYRLDKSKNLGVTELTIRQWMDEDSHTVGPRDIESIKKIALLTEDEEMLDNANSYFQACDEIRKLRRNILVKIGKAIIDRLSGKETESDLIYKTVYDKIDNLSNILEIESIVDFEKTVPIYIANRPLNM